MALPTGARSRWTCGDGCGSGERLTDAVEAGLETVELGDDAADGILPAAGAFGDGVALEGPLDVVPARLLVLG